MYYRDYVRIIRAIRGLYIKITCTENTHYIRMI